MATMKPWTRTLAILTISGSLLIAFLSCTQSDDDGQSGMVSKHCGRFLGAPLPGTVPEVFCPDLFSARNGIVGKHLHSSVYFSYDGSEVYFTLPFGASGRQSIVVMKRDDNCWSEPVVAPFSSHYGDQVGWFSPDGRRLYFGSTRPIPGDPMPVTELRWWMVERQPDSWGQPQYLSSPSSLRNDDGPLYIFAQSANPEESINIFRTVYAGNHYSAPTDIGSPPNSPFEDYPVLVAPDESYLILYRSDPSDRKNSGLFICFRTNAGWSFPKSMGDQIGTGFDASLSPCGQYLFYLKRNDGIYWVESKRNEYITAHDLNLVDGLYRIARQNARAVAATFDSLRLVHSAYYHFDHRCLGEVVKRLVIDGEFDAAVTVEQVNASLFPEARTAASALLTYSICRHSDSLEMLCRTLSETGPRLYNAQEGEINHLGYILLRAKLVNEALRIFELNIELFPESFNTYDSYAEGLSIVGRTEEAIVNYKKSLALNPQNNNARRMLSKLNGSKESE